MMATEQSVFSLEGKGSGPFVLTGEVSLIISMLKMRRLTTGSSMDSYEIVELGFEP